MTIKAFGPFHKAIMAACTAGLLAGSSAAEAQKFSVLYAFPPDGSQGNDLSAMTLVEGTDGNFYGTAYSGGDTANYSAGGGTIYKVKPSGKLTVLWAFACQAGGVCPNGRSPEGGVIQASDGNFYGTTYAGGAYNDGTIFRITPSGKLTTLYSFCDSPNTCAINSGAGPYGTLLQASNGDLYGTTTFGTVFKIDPKGRFKLLYSWPQGGGSQGALIEVGKTLYGTTVANGANNEGSVFKMSLGGKLKTLYSFCSEAHCTDGSQPIAGLVYANNALYGTTFNGGASFGTVFKITAKGAFTSLVSFEAGTTPANPSAQLTLAGDGTLYGTAQNGGGNGFVYQIANDTLANAYPLTGTQNCIGGSPVGGLLLAKDGNFYGSDDNGDCVDAGTLFAFSNGTQASVKLRAQR